MTADPRARWAAALRVPESASADDALAALLRALPETEFVPPAERVAAANALAGTAAPVGRAFDVEEALRDEVTGFAARFWSLAPPDRLVAWADLSRRGADAVRLRELEPGLDVAVSTLADPAAEELAALVRELFVLPPRARAIRRNQWLLEHAADADAWRAAHAALLRDAPALAALEPRLKQVLEPASRATLAEFAEGATAHPLDRTRASGAVYVARQNAPASRTAGGEAGTPGYVDGEYAYEAADGRRARSILHGSLVALITLVGGCCVVNRFLPRSGSDGARPSAPTAWNYAPGRTDSAPRTTFTDAEVNDFEFHERTHGSSVRSTPPRDYWAWVAAGRPRVRGAAAPPVGRVVYTTEEQIRAFQSYDIHRSGLRPEYYAEWVRSNRPTKPGPLYVSAYP